MPGISVVITLREGSGWEAEAEWLQSGDKLLAMTLPFGMATFYLWGSNVLILPTGVLG